MMQTDENMPVATEMPQAVPQLADANRQAATCKSALPGTQNTPVRRVGTITMGIALILTGVLLCITLFVPTLDIIGLFRFAPLLLVLLGVEILVAYARMGSGTIKYDVLSMLLCALLILCATGATCVAAASLYYTGVCF